MALKKCFFTLPEFLPRMIFLTFPVFVNAQNTVIYGMGDNTGESDFNRISRSAQRATRDLTDLPKVVSLKQYAPTPGTQGKQGTCVAWSSSYAARTISYCIQHNITDRAKINALAFSPNYIYYQVKSPGDADCSGGANVESAMKALIAKGDLLITENIPDCISTVNDAQDAKAKDYTIKAYASLTNVWKKIEKNEYLAIKKSIAEKKPIIFSLRAYKSITRVGPDGQLNTSENDTLMGNHALCIIGYDDDKFGGAFEVMNSWGTSWGNKGFFWITYDQLMQYGSYALELMDREVYGAEAKSRGLGVPQIKGSIEFMLADEAGADIGQMPVDAAMHPGENGNSTVVPGYTLSNRYAAGKRFKIKFTTNAPAFVYIFSVDDHQVVSPMFPYRENISAAINSPDETIYLPSERKGYRINNDAKKDEIYILYSKSPVDFENLQRRISGGASKPAESLKTIFGRQLLVQKNLQVSQGKIQFSAPAGEEEMICFSVDLNHE